MDNLKSKIIGLTIGIRYARSFRVPDISGEIIDNILYSPKSPFNNEVFPNIQENSAREKTLFNRTTSEYIRVNTDDLIFGMEVKDNFYEKIEWLKSDVISYFKDHLFKDFGLKNILRIGIVFHHKLPKEKRLQDLIGSLTNSSLSDTQNINISFSRRGPADEGIFRSGVSDYKNTIYTFSEVNNESLFVNLDYQYYYDPAIEDLRQCYPDKFFDDATNFLENNFYKWLKYEEK